MKIRVYVFGNFVDQSLKKFTNISIRTVVIPKKCWLVWFGIGWKLYLIAVTLAVGGCVHMEPLLWLHIHSLKKWLWSLAWLQSKRNCRQTSCEAAKNASTLSCTLLLQYWARGIQAQRRKYIFRPGWLQGHIDHSWAQRKLSPLNILLTINGPLLS